MIAWLPDPASTNAVASRSGGYFGGVEDTRFVPCAAGSSVYPASVLQFVVEFDRWKGMWN
jgi:hypothetical protein